MHSMIGMCYNLIDAGTACQMKVFSVQVKVWSSVQRGCENIFLKRYINRHGFLADILEKGLKNTISVSTSTKFDPVFFQKTWKESFITLPIFEQRSFIFKVIIYEKRDSQILFLASQVCF